MNFLRLNNYKNKRFIYSITINTLITSITINVRRLNMKIKIPIKEMEKDDVYSKVEDTLKKDPNNAYTIGGIMVTAFGVQEEDIHNKPFSAWKKGQPTLYGRIDRCLKKMAQNGFANCRKHERAMVYWYKSPKYTITEK